MKYLLPILLLIGGLLPAAPLYGSATDNNALPTAVATASTVNGVAPMAVILDGSGSTGGDGMIVSYDWAWNGGSTTGEESLITLVNIGTYAVTLTVTDDSLILKCNPWARGCAPRDARR